MSVDNRRNALKKIGAGSALSASSLKWAIPTVSIVSLPVHAMTSTTAMPPSITVDIDTCVNLQTDKQTAGFTFDLGGTPRGTINVGGDSFSGSIVLEVTVGIELGGNSISNQTETITITGPGAQSYELNSFSESGIDSSTLNPTSPLVETVTVSLISNNTTPMVSVDLPSPEVRSANVGIQSEIISGALSEEAVILDSQIASCV